VFLLIGKAVLAGRLWCYHFEDQAVELVVRIIRTYIAEHRSIFEKESGLSPRTARTARPVYYRRLAVGQDRGLPSR
jgi:hypothetical protein